MGLEVDNLVANTGMVLPLAGQIVALAVQSGASRLEIHTALSIVGTLLPTLPVPLVSENAASPDLFPNT